MKDPVTAFDSKVPTEAWQVIPARKRLPKRFACHRSKHEGSVTARDIELRICAVFMGVLAAIIIFFLGRYGWMPDLFASVFIFILFGIPTLYVCAYLAFTDCQIYCDGQKQEIVFRNRWMSIPTKSRKIPIEEVEFIGIVDREFECGREANAGDLVSVLVGGFSGIPFLGELLRFGVHMTSAQNAKAVFCLQLRLKSGTAALTHPCQNLAGTIEAIETIQAIFQDKIRTLHMFRNYRPTSTT